MHVFTHEGIISGNATQGNRKLRVQLRTTPSGSHWVTKMGRKFPKNGGGQTGEKWPAWHLIADSIRPLKE